MITQKVICEQEKFAHHFWEWPKEDYALQISGTSCQHYLWLCSSKSIPFWATNDLKLKKPASSVQYNQFGIYILHGVTASFATKATWEINLTHGDWDKGFPFLKKP